MLQPPTAVGERVPGPRILGPSRTTNSTDDYGDNRTVAAATATGTSGPGRKSEKTTRPIPGLRPSRRWAGPLPGHRLFEVGRRSASSGLGTRAILCPNSRESGPIGTYLAIEPSIAKGLFLA